jgi:hypothetical protein
VGASLTDRYDQIGRGYVRTRREDPRFAARIAAALGEARTVANVGAGAGLGARACDPPDGQIRWPLDGGE